MTTATPTIATAMPTTLSQCQNASMDTIRCYPGNVLASSNANAKKKKILRIYSKTRNSIRILFKRTRLSFEHLVFDSLIY